METTVEALATVFLFFCLLTDPGAAPRGPCGVACLLLSGTVSDNLFNLSHLLICWPSHTSNFLLLHYILKLVKYSFAWYAEQMCYHLPACGGKYYVLNIYQLVPGILHTWLYLKYTLIISFCIYVYQLSMLILIKTWVQEMESEFRSKYGLFQNTRNMICLLFSRVSVICHLWQNKICPWLLVSWTFSMACHYHFLCHLNFHYGFAEGVPWVWFIWP